jgi:hypothetical protein
MAFTSTGRAGLSSAGCSYANGVQSAFFPLKTTEKCHFLIMTTDSRGGSTGHFFQVLQVLYKSKKIVKKSLLLYKT